MSRYIAFFGRIMYNYDEKYLASVSLRRDGSSKFGSENKWGWFPAVSLGWRISGENFMDSQKWCNDLKLRAGFGVTGNNLGSDLRSVAMLSNGGTFWYNGQYVYTYGVSQNVNPDLRWEKKYEYNVGLDYSLFSNRVYGSLDTYYRQTRDLLWDYEVPTPPYQYTTLLANAGQMDSYGAELSVSVVPVRRKEFTWITTPTISYNKNYITKLSDPSKGFNYKETTSGGVGENDPATREQVCSGLEFMGVEFDCEANEGVRGKDKILSKDSSRVKVMVTTTDEELVIATDTFRLTGK